MSMPSMAYDFEAPLAGSASTEDFASTAQRIVAEGRGANGRADSRTHKPEEYMYWKVREDAVGGWLNRRGWIIQGPGPGSVRGEEDVIRFGRIKQATPLYQFGSYEGGGGGNFGSDGRNPLLVLKESPASPYGALTELFQRPGGLAAVPKSQLVWLGYHRKPEILKARPDLADVVDIECPLRCPSDSSPTGISVFATQSAVDQHMSVAHRNERQAELSARINAQAIENVGRIANPTTSSEDRLAAMERRIEALASENERLRQLATVPVPVADPDSRPQLLKYIAEHKLPLPEGRSVMSLTKDEALVLVTAHRAQSLTADPE